MNISESNLRKHLEIIIGARHHGTEKAEKHLRRVEGYITAELQQLGFITSIQNFSFDTMITAWGRRLSHRQGTNIIAEKPGKSEKVLIIATHHDTVPGSPGADDNGSGVVALLELARILGNMDLNYTIRLISFDLEEAGLIGSEYYVQHLTDDDRKKIEGVLILEMLGYYTETGQQLPQGFGLLYRKEVKRLKKDNENNKLRGDFLTCVFRGEAKHLARAFKYTATVDTMKVALIRDAVDFPIVGRILNWAVPSLQNLLRSDHTPFWYRDIPAAMITDTANFRNPNYHLPSDTIDTIDFTGLQAASTRVLDAILYLDENIQDKYDQFIL